MVNVHNCFQLANWLLSKFLYSNVEREKIEGQNTPQTNGNGAVVRSLRFVFLRKHPPLVKTSLGWCRFVSKYCSDLLFVLLRMKKSKNGFWMTYHLWLSIKFHGHQATVCVFYVKERSTKSVNKRNQSKTRFRLNMHPNQESFHGFMRRIL